MAESSPHGTYAGLLRIRGFPPLLATAFLGALNLYVMYNYDEQTWAYFKVWGMMGLLFLFAIGQAIWISRHAPSTATDRQP